MRKITEESVKAFLNKGALNKQNMKVYFDEYDNKSRMLLHNNCIATHDYQEDILSISACNWFTRTTKERLNALPNVNIVQRNKEWYLNGEQWDGERIDIPAAEVKPKDNLNFMNAFLMLSDLENDNIKDKVKSKQRIVFATMRANIPDWQPPKDWETLTDTEKLKRLEQIQKM